MAPLAPTMDCPISAPANQDTLVSIAQRAPPLMHPAPPLLFLDLAHLIHARIRDLANSLQATYINVFA
jgi:hypothetical protein